MNDETEENQQKGIFKVQPFQPLILSSSEKEGEYKERGIFLLLLHLSCPVLSRSG